MVVIAVDSLPLDSIPSTIVAVAGVSSHGDRLPPRFCNTTTPLSRLPPTISLSLLRSANFLTLSSPFQRLAHAVSAFPSTFSRCFCLSSDFLTLSPLPPTFSLPVSPTLYQVFHFVLLSLFTSDFVLPKRIYRLTSAHVTMSSI